MSEPTPIQVPSTTGTTPSSSDDPDVKRKKYEELLATAKLAYNYEWLRIDVAEGKAARFVPVMAILLGFNAAGLQLFVPAVSTACSFTEWLFVVAFVAFSAANLFAISHFILALAIAKVMGIPADGTIPKLFVREPYLDTLWQMSDSFFVATRQERAHTKVKIKHLKRGYWGLVTSIAAGVTAVACYVFNAS